MCDPRRQPCHDSDPRYQRTAEPTFNWDTFSRPPLGTFSPTFLPTRSTLTPTLSPSRLPTHSALFLGSSLPDSAEIKYSGAECWVWILIGTLLGFAFGMLLMAFLVWLRRNKVAQKPDATVQGNTDKPLIGSIRRESDTTLPNSQVQLGTLSSQPGPFFPGQSLRSDTQSTEGAAPEQKKPDVRLEDLEKGMTLEGTSYQYFHPDDGKTMRANDDSPRVSFTFGGE